MLLLDAANHIALTIVVRRLTISHLCPVRSIWTYFLHLRHMSTGMCAYWIFRPGLLDEFFLDLLFGNLHPLIDALNRSVAPAVQIIQTDTTYNYLGLQYNT